MLTDHLRQNIRWLNGHGFTRWLYLPIWGRLLYSKFGAPDPLHFVSLTTLGHRHALAEPEPPPAEPVPSPREEPRKKIVHLADYTNFPLFLTEFRGPTKPAA